MDKNYTIAVVLGLVLVNRCIAWSLLRRNRALRPEKKLRLIETSGQVTQFVCIVRRKRQVSKTLAFVDIDPVDANGWIPRGSRRGEAVSVQLILGASLEKSVGSASSLSNLLRRVRQNTTLLVEASPANWNATRFLVRRQKTRHEIRRQLIVERQLDLKCLSLKHISWSLDEAPRSPKPRALVPRPKVKKIVKDPLRLPSDIQVILIDSIQGEAADLFNEMAVSLEEGQRIGLDAEWEGDSGVALLQLAFGDIVFILDFAVVNDMNAFALPLQVIREKATIVGFALENDIRRLAWDHIYDSIELRGARYESLSELALTVFGKPLDKSLQRSRWATNRPLSAAMLEYAALDAWLPLAAARSVIAARNIHVDSSQLDNVLLGSAAKAKRSSIAHPKDAALLALAGDQFRDAVRVTDYDKRSGCTRLADATVLFVNWPATSRYPNALRFDSSGLLTLTWWPPPRVNIEARFEAQEPVHLFARANKKQPYLYLGTAALLGPIPGDEARGGLLLSILKTADLQERRSQDAALDRLLELGLRLGTERDAILIEDT